MKEREPRMKVCLITVLIRSFVGGLDLLICLIFHQGRQIGKKETDIKFLKDRDRCSPGEFFHGKTAFGVRIHIFFIFLAPLFVVFSNILCRYHVYI